MLRALVSVRLFEAPELQERFPRQPLLPPNANIERRARIRFVLRFHDLYINPHVKELFKFCDPRQLTRPGALESTVAALTGHSLGILVMAH